MSDWNDAELDRLGNILNSTKLAQQNCTSITPEFKCDSGNDAIPKYVNGGTQTSFRDFVKFLKFQNLFGSSC